VPDAPSSQPGSASAKRKRRGEDDENDASDGEEMEEDDDGSIESAGEEELKDARRKAKKPTKKPAQKKPRVYKSLPNEGGPAIRLPTRSKKPKKVAIVDKSAGGFYGESVCMDSRLPLIFYS
jgi:cohesin complex subunit SA-1/2